MQFIKIPSLVENSFDMWYELHELFMKRIHEFNFSSSFITLVRRCWWWVCHINVVDECRKCFIFYAKSSFISWQLLAIFIIRKFLHVKKTNCGKKMFEWSEIFLSCHALHSIMSRSHKRSTWAWETCWNVEHKKEGP